MEVKSLGEYLYQYRMKNKLSVHNLHEITGVSQPYLSQIESGGKIPSRKVVDKISRGIANNDKIDIKNIHNELLKLAGYSEINYVDSLIEAFNMNSLEQNRSQDLYIKLKNNDDIFYNGYELKKEDKKLIYDLFERIFSMPNRKELYRKKGD